MRNAKLTDPHRGGFLVLMLEKGRKNWLMNPSFVMLYKRKSYLSFSIQLYNYNTRKNDSTYHLLGGSHGLLCRNMVSEHHSWSWHQSWLWILLSKTEKDLKGLHKHSWKMASCQAPVSSLILSSMIFDVLLLSYCTGIW